MPMDKGADSYRRFLDGDRDAMVEIIRDYKDGLMMYLYRFTNDINTAEELTEDTFFRLYTKRPRFSPKHSFKTWLYTIGRNLTLNHLRKQKWISGSSIDECTHIAAPSDIEIEYIKKEQNLELYRTLDKLKPDYRQVLYLAYIEGFSTDETARIMRKSHRQIGNLLYRAKKALREQLGKEGSTYEKL